MGRSQLTKCELELMGIVWARGRVTVQEVVDVLTRPLAYTTVMSTMNTLESKQAIRRCGKSGRAYIYEALISKHEVQNEMTANLTDSLFGGSAKSLVMNLLGNDSLSPEDIDELRAAIKKLEAQV